jgi:lipoic acid synthetase
MAVDARAGFASRNLLAQGARARRRELPRLKETLRELDLYTVCEEARCPNVGECWSQGTRHGDAARPHLHARLPFLRRDDRQPAGASTRASPSTSRARSASSGSSTWSLTMVDRDDLLDGGASHVART